MIVYDFQERLAPIVTKIMRKHHDRIRRQLQPDIIVSKIGSDGFRFEKDQSETQFDPDIVRAYEFSGESDNHLNARMWFRTVILQNNEPKVVTYQVNIKGRKITCVPDDYENGLSEVKGIENFRFEI